MQLRSPPEDILARKSKLLQVVDSEVTAFSLTQVLRFPEKFLQGIYINRWTCILNDTVIILKNIFLMLQTQDKSISDVSLAVEPIENVRFIAFENYNTFKGLVAQ